MHIKGQKNNLINVLGLKIPILDNLPFISNAYIDLGSKFIQVFEKNSIR